jgi:hypothetical protein
VTDVDDLRAELELLRNECRNALAGLSAQLDDIQATPPPPPAPPRRNPRRWADRATPQEWDELCLWVDNLNRAYSLSNAWAVPVCWDQHPGVVEELSAIHQSWIVAVVTQEAVMRANTGDTGLSIWHTHALWPCLDRLKGQRYQSGACTRDHTDDHPARRQ